MFEEREEKGKKYRLFWEDVNISHPEGSAGLIYSMADHKEIYRYNAPPGETKEDVKKKIRGLFEYLKNDGLL